ncbi:hypothetical protein ScPMuIL_018200 [Solemya velum]
MIEFCTKKRMAFVILLLISLSVITLVLESRWSDKQTKELQSITDFDSSNHSCKSGQFKVKTGCKLCSRKELRTQMSYCQKTGYKEVVECENDGRLYSRSCDLTSDMEERSFYIFEGASFVIGIAAYSIVRQRQKMLDHMLMEKVNRQIAAGV